MEERLSFSLIVCFTGFVSSTDPTLDGGELLWIGVDEPTSTGVEGSRPFSVLACFDDDGVLIAEWPGRGLGRKSLMCLNGQLSLCSATLL